MRCLWEISIRSPLRKASQRPLRNISKEITFLRRLKHISRKMPFEWHLWDVSIISQKRCLFRDVSKTYQNYLSQVFVFFQKYLTKMIWCDFRRVIAISNNIDMVPLRLVLTANKTTITLISRMSDYKDTYNSYISRKNQGRIQT